MARPRSSSTASATTGAGTRTTCSARWSTPPAEPHSASNLCPPRRPCGSSQPERVHSAPVAHSARMCYVVRGPLRLPGSRGPGRSRPMRLMHLALALLCALAFVVPSSPALAAPDTVQVYFSRDPDSLNDFTAVFPLARDVTPGDQGLAGAALEALIAGPTATEKAPGYFSGFGTRLVGTSSVCKSGADFVL